MPYSDAYPERNACYYIFLFNKYDDVYFNIYKSLWIRVEPSH